MNVVELLNVLSEKEVNVWADGDQLRLYAPKDALTPTLLGQLKEHKDEILSWLKEREKDSAPLSHGQQAMWFLYQLAPQSVAYNLMIAARLSPALDVSALQQAAQALVARHPILRTTYTIRDEMPVQVVHEQATYPEYFEVTQTSNWGQEEVDQWINSQADRPFDLEEGPVLRMNLLTRQGTHKEFILLLVVHHIAADFLSFQILTNDLEALYQAAVDQADESQSIGKLPLQYKDYVRWEAEELKASETRLAAYWQEALAGAPTMLNLATDRPRPPLQSYRGAQISFEIDETMSKQIKELARAHGATPYMAVLAAFAVLLHRHTDQPEIVIGSPTQSRQLSGTEKIIGYFVNPVVLRIDLTGNPEFKSLLDQVRQTVVAAIKHQGYPFPLLVEQLQANRDPSFSPIFQAGFAWEQPPYQFDSAHSPEKKEALSLITETLASGQRGSAFDLNFMIFDMDTSLSGSFQYRTDLFDESTIYRYVGHFQTLLEGIIRNPEQPIAHLPLLTEAEREHLFISKGHAATERADSPKLCIHQLFEQQVERTPDAVAVVFDASGLDGKSLETTATYRELNLRANQLAHKLQSLGIGPDKLVGLCVENSLEMMVGLFGILKAGGAYVPISPTYPQERLHLMLETANLSVLVTQEQLHAKLPTASTPILCLDSDWAEIASQKSDNPETPKELLGNLVYVIFTSGSTGQPKCAGVYHKSFTNLVSWFVDQFGLNATDKVLVTSSFSFDLTQKNFFAPLLVGGQVQFSADAPLDYKAMRHHISKHAITWLNCTPSAFYPFVDNEGQEAGREQLYASLSSLRHLFLGGEAISMSRLRPWLQSEACHATVVNTYGPTECTDVVSSYTIVESDVASDEPIPIGRSISNVNLYILNEEWQPVPIHVPGELYIGGICVGAGYLNDATQTNETFIPLPLNLNRDEDLGRKEVRLYKTGDLARWRADGNIEFLGRSDHQVKLRGFRIELGEIETLLSQHPAVRDAIVTVHGRPEEQSEQLVAILVPQPDPKEQDPEKQGKAELEPDTIRSYLKQKLPDYMVPQVFLILDHLPLTPNGKVDRQVLSKLIPTSSMLGASLMPPRDKLEEELVQMWEALLHVHSIGIQDNFFELGGNSMFIIRFLNQLEKPSPDEGRKLALDLAPATIFRNPTIEELANFIRSQQ